MKQMIALTLALALLGGCGSAPPASSASQQLSGETVSGIITKVNGNEISLELVTLRQGAGALPAGEEETGTEAAAPPSGGSGQGQGQRDRASGQGDRGTKTPPAGQNGGAAGESFGGGVLPEAGGMPPGAGGDGGAGTAAQSYTRTGKPPCTRFRWGRRSSPLPGPAGTLTAFPPTC